MGALDLTLEPPDYRRSNPSLDCGYSSAAVDVAVRLDRDMFANDVPTHETERDGADRPLGVTRRAAAAGGRDDYKGEREKEPRAHPSTLTRRRVP